MAESHGAFVSYMPKATVHGALAAGMGLRLTIASAQPAASTSAITSPIRNRREPARMFIYLPATVRACHHAGPENDYRNCSPNGGVRQSLRRMLKRRAGNSGRRSGAACVGDDSRDCAREDFEVQPERTPTNIGEVKLHHLSGRQAIATRDLP